MLISILLVGGASSGSHLLCKNKYLVKISWQCIQDFMWDTVWATEVDQPTFPSLKLHCQSG